ncbi:MAG: hypothetical protein M3Q77_08710, partial [Thermoproteota archaeon]|nr:hypothetical protein [Thermoproteota archaeon]
VILRVFEESEDEYLYKNQIHRLILNKKKERRTGLDDLDYDVEFQPYSLEGISSKEYFLGAIKILYHSGLIEKFEGEKDNREDKFRLSDKGKKISLFLKQLDEYQKNYFNLDQSIRERIPHKSKKELEKLKHHESGWKDKDIEFYFTYRSNALDLVDLMDKNLIHIALYRYSKIMDYFMEDSFFSYHKAKMILNDIMIKVFENRIIFILEKYKVYEESARARWIENYRNPINQTPQFEEIYETGLFGALPFYKIIENFFNYKIIPKIIERNIIPMVSSYLKLIEFPKDRLSEGDINYFFIHKSELLAEYISQNKQRDMTVSKINYDYEHLIKIRFDTRELFEKILKEYINYSYNFDTLILLIIS